MFEDILAFFQANSPAIGSFPDVEINLKDFLAIDSTSAYKQFVNIDSHDLTRSEDDEGVDSDENLEDVENDEFSLSEDEQRPKKRPKRKGRYVEFLRKQTCNHIFSLSLLSTIFINSKIDNENFLKFFLQ